MKRIFGAIFCALLALGFAHAQESPLQGGPWTPGHAPMYVGQGTGQAVLQDSGPAGGGGIDVGLSEQLLVARGIGNPPFAGQGTGPSGTNWCDYDAPLNSINGYHYLCLSANAQGGGLITYGAGGGAPALPLQFLVNGSYASGLFPGPIIVGGGTPIDLAGFPTSTLSSLFVPLAPRTTADPVLYLSRSTTYSTGATSNVTEYIETAAAFSSASAWAGGTASILEITGNTVSVGNPFGEAVRGVCYLAPSITNETTCEGAVFIASSVGAAVAGNFSGVEGTVDPGVASPTPPSFPGTAVNFSFIASSNGLAADAGYVINPYNTAKFQAGFECAKEQGVAAGSIINYACFEGAVTAPYGLDLHLGNWTTYSIYAPGFAVLPSGVANTPEVEAGGTHPTLTLAGGTCAGTAIVGGSATGIIQLSGACASGNTLTLSALPSMSTGQACRLTDITTPLALVSETSFSTTTAVFTFQGTSPGGNFTATGATDYLQYHCDGY